MQKTLIRIVASLLACACLSSALSADAQVTSHAVVALSATLPSTVTVSESIVPVSILITNGGQSTVQMPANVKWNLNPREAQGFRVLATFVGAGLGTYSGGTLVAVPAYDIETGFAGAEFRRFGEKTRGVVLMQMAISPSNRQGAQETAVQFRINEDRLATLPDGVYTGWVKLEAQIL